MITLAVVLTATVVCIAVATVCLAWSPNRESLSERHERLDAEARAANGVTG